MYDWQLNPNFRHQFQKGQGVRLNEQWSAFRYLERTFGHMFPSVVTNVNDDVITIGKITFARQCLQPN